MDLSMLVMDGYAATEAIRRHELEDGSENTQSFPRRRVFLKRIATGVSQRAWMISLKRLGVKPNS